LITCQKKIRYKHRLLSNRELSQLPVRAIAPATREWSMPYMLKKQATWVRATYKFGFI